MDALPDVTRWFHPVLVARKLGRRPVRVELAGRAYVLFRDDKGRAAALADRCPHRFAPLSRGRVRPDGRLACPYHGWHFDAEGHGRNPSQPELSCSADAFQLVERHGALWLAARDAPPGRFPILGWDDWDPAGVTSILFRAPLHVALDNFSENEHTPWVHTRLGWDEASAGAIDFSAENFPDRTEVRYRARQRPTPLGRLLLARPGDDFNNAWVTRFDPVRSDYTISWSDPRTGAARPVLTRAVIFMVPETARTTRFFAFVYVRVLDRRLRALLPVIRRAAFALAWWEIFDDARFIPTVADTPFEMKGMRLDRFDKPLVHNHKLLQSIYWGVPSGVAPTRARPST